MTGRFIVGPIVRDLQAAEDIGDRARLGWFDKEFNFFGTTYVKNDEQYYLISSNATRIYDFINDSMCKDVFCTPIERYIKKCSVPSGTEDSMAKELKVLLGKKIREQYPKDLISAFQSELISIQSDDAKKILDYYKAEIDGLFDEEQLKNFQLLIDYAYIERKLTRHSYDEYLFWLADVRADMDDDLIVKDIFNKTLYCLKYKENNQWKIMVNTQKDHLYSKKSDLSSNGIFSLPIYGKTYWYNTDYRLSDVREDFRKYLETDQMRMFFSLALDIHNLPNPINTEIRLKIKDDIFNHFSKFDGAKKMINYYSNIWNCTSII